MTKKTHKQLSHASFICFWIGWIMIKNMIIFVIGKQMPQLYRWDYRQENVDYGEENQEFCRWPIKKTPPRSDLDF